MQAPIDRSATVVREASLKLRLVRAISSLVFVALLVLLFVTAIPYGTAEAWWKAFFVCGIFGLAVLWSIERFLNNSRIQDGLSLLLPLLVLVVFSFLQTISFQRTVARPGGISVDPWNAISADPYETRFFAVQLLGLILAGAFLYSYVRTKRRLRILINTVLALAVVSAIYGIVRQIAQHDVGFGLPLIRRDQGYGQFINKNHFAYLMEMGLGLVLGMVLGGAIKREQLLFYCTALLTVWTGLALCNSRGGLFAMLMEVVVAALLFASVVEIDGWFETDSRLVGLVRALPVRLLLLIVMVFGVILGTLLLGGDRLATKIEQSSNDLNVDASATRQGVSRKEIWQLTGKIFAANPIVGVGMGGYWAAVPEFHDASGALTPQEAHNDYLELLASGGLVGAAIGVWFVTALFKRTRENLRSPNRFRRAACYGAAIGLMGVAVHSILDFGLHMIVNALVFTTLVVIATSEQPWDNERIRES